MSKLTQQEILNEMLTLYLTRVGPSPYDGEAGTGVPKGVYEVFVAVSVILHQQFAQKGG